MLKKLKKHGNSLALVIEKPILKVLKIDEGTELVLSIEDGALVIRPKSETESLSKEAKMRLVQQAAEEIMDQYEDVFKKLAK